MHRQCQPHATGCEHDRATGNHRSLFHPQYEMEIGDATETQSAPRTVTAKLNLAEREENIGGSCGRVGAPAVSSCGSRSTGVVQARFSFSPSRMKPASNPVTIPVPVTLSQQGACKRRATTLLSPRQEERPTV